MHMAIIVPMAYSIIDKISYPSIIFFILYKKGASMPPTIVLSAWIINHILRICPVLLRCELTGYISPCGLCVT